MKLRMLALFLILSGLLSGCSALLNRSYSAEEPHSQFSDEDQDSDILRAETYQGLYSAILYLITQGEESGVIRLYEYAGPAEGDLEEACAEITEQDPLGAYAVDYIRYEINRVMSYYEVELKIVYKRSWQQISNVISVTGGNAVVGELREALTEFREETVLRVRYSDQTMQAESIIAIVEEAYYDVPESAFGRPVAQVQLYPERVDMNQEDAEQPSGQQRLVEAILEYPQPLEALREQQRVLLLRSRALAEPLLTLPEAEKIDAIVKWLRAEVEYSPESGAEWATTYAALVEGKANEEGFSLAVLLLCQETQLQCQVIQGVRNGKAHFWNIVQVDGRWQHLDLTAQEPALLGDLSLAEAGYRWSGDVPACQEIILDVP